MWGIWLLLSHCPLSLTSSGNDDLILGMSIQATELERGAVIPLIIVQGKRVRKLIVHIFEIILKEYPFEIIKLNMRHSYHNLKLAMLL